MHVYVTITCTIIYIQVISEGVSQVDSEEEWKVVQSGGSGNSPTEKSDSSPPVELKPPSSDMKETPVLAVGERVCWFARIIRCSYQIYYICKVLGVGLGAELLCCGYVNSCDKVHEHTWAIPSTRHCPFHFTNYELQVIYKLLVTRLFRVPD